MQISSLKLVRAYDRDVGAALVINDEVICTVNYDEHGSSGEDVLKSVLEGLSDLTGLKVEEDEMDDEEYREFTA